MDKLAYTWFGIPREISADTRPGLNEVRRPLNPTAVADMGSFNDTRQPEIGCRKLLHIPIPHVLREIWAIAKMKRGQLRVHFLIGDQSQPKDQPAMGTSIPTLCAPESQWTCGARGARSAIHVAT